MTQPPKHPPIYVTSPHLPPSGSVLPYLQQIWSSKRLTNEGPLHNQFERALESFLASDAPNDPIHATILTNGTLALVLALDAMRVTGEVITTPFTFIATANALYWKRLKPVFVDIDPVSLNIDPKRIQEAITPETSAILAVHVYGRPCDTTALAHIAATHNLKLIYDAAHAFGASYNDLPLASYGDLSVLSFHATKGFNTLEGGAIVSHSEEMKSRIDRLRNFGFLHPVGEEIMEPGLNAKMDEFRSAIGLLELEQWPRIVAQRSRVAARYDRNLGNFGRSHPRLFENCPVKTLTRITGAVENFTYYPVRILSSYRDQVYARLATDFNINCRRYFYPLVSTFPAYRTLPSASPANLPVATRLASEILCLPIYPDLSDDSVDYICQSLETCLRAASKPDIF